MKCRQCGYLASVVTKTMTDAKFIQRRRLCACGWSWSTRELEVAGTGSSMAINDCGQKTLLTSGGQGGDISDPNQGSGQVPQGNQAGACSEARAKKSPYSEEFEAAWLAYGRREEKVKAYARWKTEAKAVGGEDILRDLVLKALAWQAPVWERDGWRFAKYFERYLKARKWEDEPLPSREAVPMPIRGGFKSNAQKTQENAMAWLEKKRAGGEA